MIITFHTTKGGAGKSSAMVSALGAIAEAKYSNVEEALGWKVLAIDFDQQGTVRDFFTMREERNLPSYDIDFESKDYSAEINLEELALLGDRYDIILIDTPGVRDVNSYTLATVSDLMVIPTAISYPETRPAIETWNFLQEIIDTFNLDAEVALLMTKMHSHMSFWDNAAKTHLQGLIDAGYTFLEARLSLQNSVKSMLETGFYAFEQAQQAPNLRSPKNMIAEGRILLSSLISSASIPSDNNALPLET